MSMNLIWICQRRERNNRADVSEKQVDLSFLIAMHSKGVASYQSIRKAVAGPGGACIKMLGNCIRWYTISPIM